MAFNNSFLICKLFEPNLFLRHTIAKDIVTIILSLSTQ